MTQVNPFIGSAIQATGVQRTQASEKDRQLRRAADIQKDSALSGDRFEHAVESGEELAPMHDEQKQDSKKRRHHKPPKPEQPDDADPHLDLTA
jgi:hypothetical protein